MKAVARVVRPGDRILDLGAGLGVVTTRAATLAGPTGHTVAVEANPRLPPMIGRMAQANRVSIEIVNGAVGVDDGFVEFNKADHFLSSSIYQRDATAGEVIRIPQISFRGLLDRVKPSVVIFDIEGAEKEIFRAPIPDHVRAMVGEFHEHIIGPVATSAVVKDILGQGFSLLMSASSDNTLAFERFPA
ncbi:FkbM family methyltransferase [Prosthecomicrobium sp. N25]|uniref:FkbM family methyltransferase n=1 Tax=Prosthecomicrobium sp. N25 TaxID=3129254 RepID=UPI00307705CA